MKYGLPYKGSKSTIAEKIVSMLPEGERLVDLFGGGGAITHCAIVKGKYKKYLYNDYDTLTVDYFTRALKGDFNNNWVSRDDFERVKSIDGVVAYCWSFGNDGRSYLWGRDIEPYKKALYDYAMANGIRRVSGEHLQKFLSMESNKCLVKPKCLENLQSLQSLESLEGIDAILEISNISYENYVYQEGDIVYCDIPYEGTNKYNIKFNPDKFYEWVRSRKYQVYFSSYQAPDDFYKIKVGDKRVTLCATNNSLRKEEYIFSNKPIDGITYQTSLIDFI